MTNKIIGIDLGTTYSVVAVFQDGVVNIIPNDQTGRNTTPSYVAFTDDGEKLVGEEAKNQHVTNLSNTIYDVKRLIGRRFDDPALQKDLNSWNFKIINEDNKPMIQVVINGKIKKFAAEQISAFVLERMKEIAEAFVGEQITDAVITVPAYFNDAQRQATKHAGEIAGLNVCRIINEPTAAALAFGLNKTINGEQNILIYDLGGGTFDVSILNLSEGVFDVKATTGDTTLGGEDFNSLLTHYLVEEIKRKHGIDLVKNVKSLRKLQTACEKAKLTLSSSVSQAKVVVENILDNGGDFETTISKARFEELCSYMFNSTIELVEQALDDARMKKSDIHHIVLVGGSTRIPKIRQLLTNYFDGKPLTKSINPDEAVALGAALQAAVISGDSSEKIEDIVLLDVTPLSLGIEIVSGEMSVLIKKNTTIPAEEAQMFTTHYDNQTSVSFNVYEGERLRVENNNLLGKFILKGIKPSPARVPQIEVTFKIDNNGILNVTAIDTETKNKEQITINTDESRLSKEEIERMKDDAKKFREQDFKFQEKLNAKSFLEEYARKMKKTNSINQVAKQQVEETLKWLEDDPKAETQEYRNRLNLLVNICGIDSLSLSSNSPQPAGNVSTGGFSKVTLRSKSDDSSSKQSNAARDGPIIEEVNE